MSSIGRSPFPSRNRRRLELDDSMTNSFASPSFAMMPASASFARSPSYISPRNNGKTRRSGGGGVSFFDRSPPQAAAQQQAASTTGSGSSTMNLQQIRDLAQVSLGTSSNAPSPDMAVFYASILYSKTQTPEDAFFYAQTLFANHEYRRAVRVLEEQQDESITMESVLLAAQALSKLGEWHEASVLLEDASRVSEQHSLTDDDEPGWQSLIQMHSTSEAASIHPIARLCLWRAKCYDATSHPPRAKLFWKRSLQIDSKCVAALDHLLHRHLLEPQESVELIESLSFPDTSMDWLKQIYLARLPIITTTNTTVDSGNENEPPPSFLNDASSIQMDQSTAATNTAATGAEEADNSNNEQPSSVDNALQQLTEVHQLDQSPEVLALAAIRAYRRYDLQSSFQYCQELMRIDPLHSKAAFCHAATLLALDSKRLLFSLAHAWVAATPQEAKSWFAVGCYYYACRRYHVAQQHFLRATRLDPVCTDAWIAFGCAFAACDESDQALASFRAAQRLAPAESASLLYMGMEYIRTNHLVLAQHALLAAVSGGDALVWNELGVVHFLKKDYEQSISYFTKCVHAILQLEQKSINKKNKNITHAIELISNDYWEPTLFNLGHAYRKTLQFDLADACFRHCLALDDGNASAYMALGFSLQLQGNLQDAIFHYHQSLSQKPDDSLCAELLNRALSDALVTQLTVSTTTTATTPVSNRSLKRRTPTSAFSLLSNDEDDDDVDMSMG